MIQYYADENFHGTVLNGLRTRGIDVLTPLEDRHNETDDRIVLQRATDLQRVLISQDEDMLRIATERQRNSIEFFGLIFAHKQRVSIGQCIEDLELICHYEAPEAFLNHIQHLPLQSSRP